MLTEEQIKARDHLYGPCLVSAGPGSGKTRVLTERISRLLSYTEPKRICVITFTRAAAAEMEERFAAMTDQETAEEVTFGTFHSVFLRWLIRWRILDPDIRILEQEKDDSRDISGVPAISMGQRDKSSIGFDDIMRLMDEALKSHRPDLAYDFFLIDEFQDIDELQYKIVRKMAGENANLFVVGDEDQSIYGFRGSFSSVMLRFIDDYPDARHLYLTKNFRCSNSICEMSLRLIRHNRERFDKSIVAASDDETEVKTLSYPTTMHELREAAKKIRRLHVLGKVPYEQMAVLARTGREADMMIQALREAGIAYREKPASTGFVHSGFLDIENDIRRIENAERQMKDKENVRILERYFPIVRMMERKDLSPDAAIEKEQLKNFLRRLQKGSDRRKMLDLLWNTSYSAYLADKMRKQRIPFLYPFFQFFRMNEEPKEGVFVNTLHQAKGLEFEAVWIIGLNEGNIPRIEALESPAGIEEERRLLYVGMTRAKKYLSISSSEESPASRFIAQLQ